MATVRMTETLRGEILGSLKRSFAPRIKSIQDQATAELDAEAYRRAVVDAMFDSWGISREVYDAIPENWGAMRSELKVTTINGQSCTEHPSFSHVPLPAPIRLPGSMASSYSWVSLTDSRLDPFAAQLQKYQGYLDEVSAEETSTVQAAQTLLMECGNLKTALEVWPAMEAFVPQEAHDRHCKLAERKQPLGPITALDLGALNVSLAKNRLIGAI